MKTALFVLIVFALLHEMSGLAFNLNKLFGSANTPENAKICPLLDKPKFDANTETATIALG